MKYKIIDNDRNHSYVECPTCKRVFTEKGIGAHTMKHRKGYLPKRLPKPTQAQLNKWPWQHLQGG